MQADRDEKLDSIRKDYMNRMADAKDGMAKEKLLEDMHRRIKHVEDNLAEEKKRSEA